MLVMRLHRLRLHMMARRLDGGWSCQCGQSWPYARRRSLHGILWGLTGVIVPPVLRARARAVKGWLLP